MENSQKGYLQTNRYKLYEKFKTFIDARPDAIWHNELRVVGRSINDGKIIVYFEYTKPENQPTMTYEDFMTFNHLTEADLT